MSSGSIELAQRLRQDSVLMMFKAILLGQWPRDGKIGRGRSHHVKSSSMGKFATMIANARHIPMVEHSDTFNRMLDRIASKR